MRIALVHLRYSWTGGVERYLKNTAQYLLERGHEVTVVCRSRRGDADPRLEFVVLHDFAIGNAWRMWAFAGAVEDHIAEADYDVVYGLGKTWSQDVIRLGGGTEETYLELAHQATLSALDRLTFKGALQHRLTLRIENRALAPDGFRRIITNSRMVKNDVVARHDVPPDRVTVVYNGADTERFHPRLRANEGAALRQELGFEPDDVVALFLGTGYGRKGLGMIIDALPEVLANHPKTRLMVVGFDSAMHKYKARARRLGVDKVLRFLGGRSDAEVCYAASDYYVLPTLYDPFANTTVEALASGLPVITSTTNGGSEIIEPGVHGAIVNARGQAADLARHLIEWSDRDRLDAARQPTRALGQQFSAERTARESADVLEAVAREKVR